MVFYVCTKLGGFERGSTETSVNCLQLSSNQSLDETALGGGGGG